MIRRVLFAALAAYTSATIAQPVDFSEDWRWVHFTTSSGLPSNRVHALTETPDSTVWVATATGIAWFDGYQWHMAKPLPEVESSLKTLHAYGHDKVLYVHGATIHVVGKNSSDAFPLNTHFAVPLSPDSILAAQNRSLYLLHKSTLTAVDSHLTAERTLSLWRTANGTLWLDLEGGIYRRTGDSWTLFMATDVEHFIISSIVEDSHGHGLVSVSFPFALRGVWEWGPGKQPVRNTGEMGFGINAMDISADDEVIAAYVSGDIRVRRNGVWSPVPAMQSILRNVEFFRFRSNGDLWAGTHNGLYLYRRTLTRWTFIKHPPPDTRNWIHEILLTSRGHLWLANVAGVEVLRNGKFERTTRVLGKPLHTVTGLAEDDSGNVWISSGSAFGGSYRWRNGAWQHFSMGDAGEEPRIHKIRRDYNGRLWFLGLGGNQSRAQGPGAFVYEEGRFTRWDVATGLLDGRVYDMQEGPDGALWFASYKGISRWKDNTWKHWTARDGLANGRVFTLAVDKDGRIWFGHANPGGGLGVLHPDGSIRYFTTRDGLVNDYVWDVRMDDAGTLWIATEGGLASYCGGLFSRFDDKTGLNYNRLWPVLPRPDVVYAGTMGNGLAILHRRNDEPVFPRILIDQPVIEDQSALVRWRVFSWWGDLAPEDILCRHRVNDEEWSAWSRDREMVLRSLPAGEHRVVFQAKDLYGNYAAPGREIRFRIPPPLLLQPSVGIPAAALSLAVLVLAVTLALRKRKHDLDLRKSEARFRTVAETTLSAIFISHNDRIVFANPGAVQLTGYSQEKLLVMSMRDIVHPEDRDSVRLSSVHPENDASTPQQMEFRVVTKSGDVRWVSFSWCTIRFQDEPAVLAAALDITERRLAEEKLRSLATELSATEERERRRMATYLHDTIGQALAFCKMKIRLMQRSQNRNNTEERLQEILDLVEQSIADTRSLVYDLSPPILYELNFAAATEWLAAQFGRRHGLSITVEDDKQSVPMSNDVRVFLFHAIRELLVNVIKHAEARSVRIILASSEGVIRVTVEDDGKGFDHTEMEARSKQSYGLFNIKERLIYYGGRMEITPRPETGTCITLVVPSHQEPAQPSATTNPVPTA